MRYNFIIHAFYNQAYAAYQLFRTKKGSIDLTISKVVAAVIVIAFLLIFFVGYNLFYSGGEQAAEEGIGITKPPHHQD